MSDLISRQALKNSLTNWQMEYAEKSKDVERFETLGAVIELVEQLPTINPVKHGNWVGVDDEPHETFECDQCGYIYETYDGTIKWSFCPHCGARME